MRGTEEFCGSSEDEKVSQRLAIVALLVVLSAHSSSALPRPPVLHTVPVPEPAIRSGLDGVARVGTGALWAVGAYQGRASTDRTEAVFGNGKRWRLVRTPNPSPGWSHFFGVAGKGKADVWAVGTYAPSDARWPNLPFRTLAERWNGSAWAIVRAPNVGAADSLFAVGVLGPNDAWAVGGYYRSAISFQNLQCEHPAYTLIEHWNGRVWSVVRSPDPGRNASFAQPCGPSHPRTTVNVLSGISIASPKDVWAVGHYWDGSANRTLALHWNGRAWRRVAVPNASRAENVLYAVTAVSQRDVWAAGTYRPRPGARYQTLVVHWDGHLWRVVSSADVAGQDNQLFGIVSRGNDIWAVGRHGGRVGDPLAEHWNGTRWRIVPSERIAGCACSDVFNGVAEGARTVWAAGEFLGPTLHKSLIEVGPRVSSIRNGTESIHDEATVSAIYRSCAAFSPDGCPLSAVRTPDGSGRRLYVILLRAETGDECYRGIAYFFEGEHLLGNTSQLPPKSIGGVIGVRAAGPARFAVTYAVSAAKNTDCADNGDAGRDTYIYRWSGSRLIVAFGTPPVLPKVIVGSR